MLVQCCLQLAAVHKPFEGYRVHLPVFHHVQNEITTYTPVDEFPDDIEYSCSFQQCCEQLFTTCEYEGDCSDVSLRDPEVRNRLDEMAKASAILVADCKGRYTRYWPERERADNLYHASAADRILR